MKNFVQIVGPFVEPEYSHATVRGCRVPYIKIFPQNGGEFDGKTGILLDNRLFYYIDNAEVETVIGLLGDAMAVAAGYSCMGQKEKHNLYTVKLSELDGNTINE